VVDKIKNYGITGVSANVELGKSGSVIAGEDSEQLQMLDSSGELTKIVCAAGTEDQHAVNRTQFDDITLPKFSYEVFTVDFDSGTVELAQVINNTYVHRVIVEAVSVWNGADSNTNITVGDTTVSDRYFTDFDTEVQIIGETDHRYSGNDTLIATVTAGGATSGQAKIVVWYSGRIFEPGANI
jgi:hypothetical protein